MPNLFTLPEPRSGPDTVTAEQRPKHGYHYVIDAETSVYASLFRVFWSDHDHIEFTNHGVIWNISPENVAASIGGFYIWSLINTGLIISDAPQGNAYGVSVGAGGDILTNSGSIYAIGSGNANAVVHWDPDVRITNTGLVAAYAPHGTIAGVGDAIGIAMFNGGVLLNGADGSILAEGLHATAVLFGNGSILHDDYIQNDGRIEAYCLSPGTPSYGIRAGGSTPVAAIYFVNNGTLKADIAWSSYTDHPDYAPRAMDIITNNSSGRIIGIIETGRGNDAIINNGQIIGDILLGDDDDLIENVGEISGTVDLGSGNDEYHGSAATGAVTVQGGAGTDRLTGGTGNDILAGGSGVDVLTGGAGRDIFVFASLSDSPDLALRSDQPKYLRDVISDFRSGEDKIDLSAIDAISSTPENDPFTFIGTGAFSSRAGELRLEYHEGATHVLADVDGDGHADMTIVVITTGPELQPIDFLL